MTLHRIRYYSLSFPPATPSLSQTLERVFGLTLPPSKAFNLALYTLSELLWDATMSKPKKTKKLHIDPKAGPIKRQDQGGCKVGPGLSQFLEQQKEVRL